MIDYSKYPLLSQIENPVDLKRLRPTQLPLLAKEIRRFLIDIVSRTGGHLGSNLGSVELSIALHYMFNAPEDSIVWDVGAQAYTHKILTGRMKRFHTNRQYGGISGFPHRDESEYDAFSVGHSSTSISAALGMAFSRDRKGKNSKVFAVIGDGGMTGGLAYEGLNNAGVSGADITVILNDNKMAISPSVGALSQYLGSLRSHPRFERFKDGMWQLTGHLPKGAKFRKAFRGFDAGLRAMLIPGLWFERLGFRYVGPIDGHNLEELIRMFDWLKGVSGPILLHIITEKGRGYRPAEEADTKLHGVSKFNPQTGPVKGSCAQKNFSGCFSEELLKLAKKDQNIVAITPAMIEGSELVEFQRELPERCIDVGIAEQHAVTFAAGMATKGMTPVVLIYSTFLQRAYDQVVHDVALQKLKVVFGLDRSGLVGEDGPTHHGTLDISYLRHIPNLTILIPRDNHQMSRMLKSALYDLQGPIVIRFPRGKPVPIPQVLESSERVTEPDLLRDGKDGLIVGTGILLADCLTVADELESEENLKLAVLDLKCVKPLDEDVLTNFAQKFGKWLSVEENVLMGGVGSALLEFISENELGTKISRLGLPDRFITHGDRDSLMSEVGLDRSSIKHAAKKAFGKIKILKGRRSKRQKV